MKKFFNILVKTFAWLLVGTIGLLLLAIILVQTAPVKREIARIAEKQVVHFIDGKLSIGKLEGNFWNHLRLNNISLTQQNDTIANIAALDLQYNPWPLLKQEVLLQSVKIVQPQLRLIQLQDSSWNVEHIIKEQNAPDEPEDSTSGNAWQINLKKLNLQEGSIRINSADTIIPSQIKRLNILLSAFYSENRQTLRVDHFSFQTIHPDLELNRLSFNLIYADQAAELSDFVLRTAQNQIDAKAVYEEKNQKASSIDLTSTPLVINEFAFVLPDLRFKVKPELKLIASLQNNQLSSSISMEANNQKIDLTLQVAQFASWLFKPDSVNPDYKISVSLDQVRLDEWSGIEGLNHLLNGKIELSGSGVDPRSLNANLKADLFDSNIAGYFLENLSTSAKYQDRTLAASALLNASFGSLSAKAAIRNILDDPRYDIQLTTNRLNLAPLLNNDSLQSDINLRLIVDGIGFDPHKLKAKTQLNLAPSKAMEIPIDTAFAYLSYSQKTINIDSLTLKNSSAELNLLGQYSLTGKSDLDLSGEIFSLDLFRKFLPDSTIQTTGKLTANLSGPADSMEIRAKLDLDKTHYDEFSVEHMALSADGTLASSLYFETHLQAYNVISSFIELDSISLMSKIYADSLELSATVNNPDLSTVLKTGLSWKDQIKVYLQNWDIAVRNQKWTLQSPSIISIDSIGYKIDDFKLGSTGNQSIGMRGVISQRAKEDFTLDLSQFNIGDVFQTLNIDPGINGLLNGNLRITGTAPAPLIRGEFNIEDAGFSDFRFTKTKGTINYDEKLLDVNTQLVLEQGGHFLLKGKFPADLNLKSMIAVPVNNIPIDASANIVDFPLALFGPFIHTKEISGAINGELIVNGTAKAPMPHGHIVLAKGSIKLPEYGIDYRDMLLKTSFGNDVISLDTISITSSDGNLNGGGKVSFNSEFYKGDIRESTINLKFNKFNPIDHKQINMQLSGSANLTAEKDKLVFGGNLEIPRSEIYLPALLSLMGKVYTPEIPKPILVQEIEKMESHQDTTDTEIQAIELSDSLGVNAFENLTGKIKIKIPKNSWIKSPNLRLELSGDLEIMKRTDFMEIFGAIKIVRGQYELLGKTFIVSEGVITFEGGEEINPIVNLTANYNIKNRDTQSKSLQLAVEGDVNDPTISFTLNGESISEGDALSYIVFGRGLNELSASEQSDVSDASGESMAKSAAASLLASQLTKLLGKSFNVDYIEIKSQESFDSATFEVGKYLTDDLFVSYEQQIGATTDHDLSRYQVNLEYEILKFLFLQLNNSTNESGFDVIFKVNLD